MIAESEYGVYDRCDKHLILSAGTQEGKDSFWKSEKGINKSQKRGN